jgi:uncharacterized membrane protein YedE/YeeE
MELPFVLSGLTHGGEMVMSVLIGLGFGFALERAGFGDARNLTSIFYGRDFRVMRVMFPAIITAMLGLYFLDLFGIMPISNIGLLPSYVMPQVVGGLLLGAGFVIGGYCPGTSIVAMVSGRWDGLVFLVGIFIGSVGFNVAYDSFQAFHYSTSLGRVLLHESLGLPSGVLVFIISAFAVGALYAVGIIENRVNAAVAAKASK